MPSLRLLFSILAFSAAGLATSAAQFTFGASYSQNFDSLPSTGSGLTFALENWVSSDTTIDVSNGTTSTVGLKSLGAGGSADRALGSLAADSTGTIYYALRLVNNSGAVIMSLSISYYGETWRQGSATSADPYGLDFAYSRNATGVTTGTYFNFDSLDYISSVPVVVANPSSSSDGGGIDGNAAANRTLVSATLSPSGGWQPGQELWLRWSDANSNGFDSSIGIDNLSIVAVPEPACYGVAFAALLVISIVLRRRAA